MNKNKNSSPRLLSAENAFCGTKSMTNVIKQLSVLLVIISVFLSCSDLQNTNSELESRESPESEIVTSDYLSGTEYLPNPKVEGYQKAVSSSLTKSVGTKQYKRVLVHPKGEVPGSQGAPVVDNFADAIARVASGGTVGVFAGEYDIDEIIVIDRSLTIEPIGSALPLIRSTGGHAFLVAGVTEGIVTFRGLSFENKGGHSSISADSSTVLITGSVFDATGGTAGAFAWRSAKLTIEGSTFTNGVVGAFASGEETDLTLRSSTFSSHNLVAVQYQWGADGLMEGNNLSDCGLSACTRAFLGSSVDIKTNVFSDDISDSEVNGFFHHIVIYSGATGRVSDNLFDGCGHGQCVGAINGAVLDVSKNEFRIYENQKTRFVIVGSDGTGGNDPHGREVDITVTDNVITGIGGNSSIDPGNPDAYAIKLGGLLIENLGKMTAHRNTIKNANMGISVLSGGFLIAGQDNKIENVRAAVAAYDLHGLGASYANLRSNDFTGYAVAVLNDSFDPSSNLTCNWWATPAGPLNSQGALSSVSLYTPWATQPVAGSAITSCS